MKLKDLIEALAGEIELTQPQLEQGLDKLARLDADDPAFMDALDLYSGQAQRMGEAAEMAGFPGLQSVCNHVLENILLLAGKEREPVLAFLRRWPGLMVHYLRNLDDPTAAAGLVDYLLEAPSPLDEEQGLKIMHWLGAMPEQLKGSPAGADKARPLLARPDDVALQFAEDTDQAVVEGFFQEAPNQAAYLVSLTQNMISGEGDSSDIIAAKRVAHTLKGSGAIVGLRGLASLGHHIEDILEHFERHQDEKISGFAAETLLDAAYCLEQMVGYVSGADEYPEQAQAVLQNVLDVANLIDRGDSLEGNIRRVAVPDAGKRKASPPAPAAQAQVVKRPAGDAAAVPAANLRVSLQLVEELFRVSGEVSVVSAAMEAYMKSLVNQARDVINQNLRVHRRLMELENLVDIRALTMMRARSRRSEDAVFDPLEMDQYSELHSTTHALAEEAGDLRVMCQWLEDEIAKVSATQSRQQVLSRDLQHLVTGTRMTEVGVLESRLQRNVRTTAQATGKQASLELIGGDTLIDSDVLNKLAEPLLHLLRNAVDHGLESPEEREALGKPATGRIVLSFALQGQQIHLTCGDDGRGLDYRAIAQKAVEKGLIPATHALGEENIAQLILAPGFSTRDEVSEVSGRGVGLDVVHDWVNAMHGSVRVRSKSGEGCTIELRFAATLSTVHSLIVTARGNRFALPAIHVQQALTRGTGTFETMGGQVFFLHGKQVYKTMPLAPLVGLSADQNKAREEYDIIIVRVGDTSRALLVDSLLDARELLVMHPGRFGRHAHGVAGLSIMGDGGIAVDLDMAQIFADAPRAAVRLGTARSGDSPSAQQSAQTGILVVDDALTVRKSLQQLLEDAGFRTETARDGMEAVNLLDNFKPDMVLTDLEMPNMNGIELTSYLRNKEETKTMPVIMITSRSLEKHRRLADDAGVNHYITKPYNDSDLLKAIRETIAA